MHAASETACAGGAGDRAHAAALDRVAARMRRLFQLPVRDAPRLFLVGGEVDASAIGQPAGTRPLASASGTGFDLAHATAACISECVEFLSQLAPHDHGRVGGTEAEVAHGLEPEALLALLAMLGFEGDAGPRLSWLSGASVVRDASVLLPEALCIRNLADPAMPEPRVKLSSGCAAGRTTESALLHALLELVERDAVALWWIGGRRAHPLPCGPGIPPSLLAALGRDASHRTSWLLDITTDLGVPCVAALSLGADGRGLVCGFAARLDYDEAMTAAVREMCQMEVGLDLIFRKRAEGGDAEGGDAALNAVDRKHLQRAFGFDARQCPLLKPCQDGAASIRTGSLPSACPRAFWSSIEGCAGDAFWVDLTRADLGIPAVRALAPGLQPYPTDLVTPRLQREIAATGGGFGLTSGIALM